MTLSVSPSTWRDLIVCQSIRGGFREGSATKELHPLFKSRMRFRAGIELKGPRRFVGTTDRHRIFADGHELHTLPNNFEQRIQSELQGYWNLPFLQSGIA
jgi:hypothetical protein